MDVIGHVGSVIAPILTNTGISFRLVGDAAFHVHSSLEKDLSRCWGYERETPHPVAGQPSVKVKIYVSSSITFADRQTPVIETIEEVKTQVTNTLVAFKPEFK